MATYVAGHNGMVGSAVLHELTAQGVETIVRSRNELDLTNQEATRDFFEEAKPDTVVLAAAKVGGILANSEHPAEFIYQNLIIECNVIHQAYLSGVRKLLFLGSSCIYPKASPQPMAEDALLTSKLEPTNEPYAVAKIAGIKLCESYNRQYGTDYRSVMPTNLYGPRDNFHATNSHVLPALIRRFHEAKEEGLGRVTIWGTGSPRREFLHVRDLAKGSLFVLALPEESYRSATDPQQSHLNIGTGQDLTIAELASVIAKIVGFHGQVEFDTTKPDGAPRKLLDVSKLAQLGWQSSIKLSEGVEETYRWFLEHRDSVRQ